MESSIRRLDAVKSPVQFLSPIHPKVEDPTLQMESIQTLETGQGSLKHEDASDVHADAALSDNLPRKQLQHPRPIWGDVVSSGSQPLRDSPASSARVAAAASPAPGPVATPRPAVPSPALPIASVARLEVENGSERKQSGKESRRRKQPSPAPFSPTPDAGVAKGKARSKTSRSGTARPKLSNRGSRASREGTSAARMAGERAPTPPPRSAAKGGGGDTPSKSSECSTDNGTGTAGLTVRRRRKKAMTTRNLDKDKTIGTIEWARSNASAIAAAKPLRRSSPTARTSRSPSSPPLASIPEGHTTQDTEPAARLFASPGSGNAAASPAKVTATVPTPSSASPSAGMPPGQSKHHHLSPVGHDMAVPETSENDGGSIAEKVSHPVEEISHSVAPLVQLAGGQVVLLLRDCTTRMAGGEGKALVALVNKQQQSDSSSAPMAQLFGSQRQVKLSFDSVSHALLPWPLPTEDALKQLTSSGKTAPSQLAADLRRMTVPGIGQYAVGQELVALIDGMWMDARVLQPPEHISSTVHKLQAGGSTHNLLLHPWNHAPMIMRCSPYNEACARYATSMLSTHSFITDALSGQQLHVHQQCVPLHLEPSSKGGGPADVTDVTELYNWLITAQGLRRDIPSTLSKAARFSTYGPPEEAAERVTTEFSERLSTMSGDRAEQAAARDAIQLAERRVDQIKVAYLSSTDKLVRQQKLGHEDFLSNEKQQWDEQAAMQRREQESFASDRTKETDALITRHKDETKNQEREHQRQRQEQLSKYASLKRDFEQDSDKALKALKDTQFKEADTFKRKLASQRVEGEARLAALNRQELEAFQEMRAKQKDALEAKHEDEKSRIDDDLNKEADLRAKDFEQRKLELDEAHASAVKALTESQAAERSAMEVAHEDAIKLLHKSQKEQVAKQAVMQEGQVSDLSSDAPKLQLQQAHTEARNQMGVRQKDETKKFNIASEMRKTALTSKQDEERKAMFAKRRELVASGGDNVKALQAQWAEEDRKNKNAPKKEMETLEAQLAKDKANLLEKQQLEGEQLLAKQTEEADALKIKIQRDKKSLVETQAKDREQLAAQHAKDLVEMKAEHASAKVSLHEKHQKDEVDNAKNLATQQRNLDSERAKDADSLHSRKEEFRKDMLMRHAKETDQNVLRLEREKKQHDMSQDERRKYHASELEDQLTRFTARQDEERSTFMAQQKTNEKTLVESQAEEDRSLEARLAEEKVNNDTRQHEEVSDQEAKHRDQQAKLDSKHAGERSMLTTEQQKAMTKFLARQQADRDQHAARCRDELEKVVETAQNELNRALLHKVCCLISGPPAAGKTCAVSQLLMIALNDKKPGAFVPVAIKVQQLQRRLNEDRHEVERRLKIERDLYYGEEHIGFDLFTLRDLMRKVVNGKKRIKDYFEQWDTDGNGTIDREEFGNAVRQMGAKNASEDEIQSAFEALDHGNKAEIDCKGLCFKP